MVTSGTQISTKVGECQYLSWPLPAPGGFTNKSLIFLTIVIQLSYREVSYAENNQRGSSCQIGHYLVGLLRRINWVKLVRIYEMINIPTNATTKENRVT